MELDRYRRFTATLTQTLSAHGDVVGLVALGSMAERDYAPDEYSDHDFWVIVDGDAERWRRELGWLPDASDILVATRETQHGLKVVYRDGHLLELAVFARDELHVAKAGRSRVLIDRGGVEDAIAAISAELSPNPARVDVPWEVEMLATNLLVGVGRWRRGERLSARDFVLHQAVGHLLRALTTLDSVDQTPLDGLDLHRRFERASPRLGVLLDAALALPVPECARALCALVRTELAHVVTPERSALLALVERA